MLVKIDKQFYNVNNDEYNKINNEEYNNLCMYNDLDKHEILIAFLKKILNQITNKTKIIHINPSHGGFILLNSCSFTENTCYFTNVNYETQLENIRNNSKKYNNLEYQNFDNSFIDFLCSEDNLNIILTDENINDLDIQKFQNKNAIIVSKLLLSNIQMKTYFYETVNYYIYVSQSLECKFNDCFKYYLSFENYNTILSYDNLLHLCIMVKNAGPQFRNMLEHNLKFCDKWTILDTGSTDNTVAIINEVLVEKKEGMLLQEEFINFRDSRNRLLDLAGN